MAETAFHFRIEGHVQGVGFRAATQREAVTLGLTGWVRNCADGAVEGFAQSRAQDHATALDALRQWLHRGPPRAIVRSVQWQSTAPETLVEFSVRR